MKDDPFISYPISCPNIDIPKIKKIKILKGFIFLIMAQCEKKYEKYKEIIKYLKVIDEIKLIFLINIDEIAIIPPGIK
jgi:hypothetical protein